ncbi:MAG: BACON domain-containing protein [Chloroflexi bacterium]|nr:BACON domain-containing protein [Chloroflexota bacterium]
MSEQAFKCPRCGKELRYDVGMGLWWCPDVECGTVLRRESVGHGPTGGGFGPPHRQGISDTGTAWSGDGEEWRPEKRHVGRNILVGLVMLVTIVAVLVMTLSPLAWPRGPVLSVSPTHITFVDDSGAGVMPQAFAIQNDGKGQLDWRVTSDVSWLVAEPAGGYLDGELQVVTLRADITGLSVGEHVGVCTVTASGARNSPQVVGVSLRVEQTPEARALLGLLGEGVEVFYGEQPPYVAGPTGVAIELVNNGLAVDVSWDQLVDFVTRDDTDESPYIQDLRMCGSFAEALHNDAEAAGIRCAWVSLDMAGQEIGHALNAFLTTDKGIAFVDCTGEDTSFVAAVGAEAGTCDYDKIAYVQVGQEYGLISLDRAESLVYPFYVEYSKKWADYLADLEEFNALADEYNALVEGRTLIAGSSEARRAQRLYDDLQRRRVDLEMQQELLGPCRWESIGVVEHVELYW